MENKKILDELAWLVSPVYEAVESKETMESFFKQFGYDVTTWNTASLVTEASGMVQSFTTILESLDKDSDEFDPAILVDIFRSIKSISDTGQIKSKFGTEFFEEIFAYLVDRYLSIKIPFLHTVLFTLGVIEVIKKDSSDRGVEYYKIKLNWDNLADFFTDNKRWGKNVIGWAGNPSAGDKKSLDYKFLFNTLALLLESSGRSIVITRELTPAELTGFVSNIPSGEKLFGATMPVFQKNIDTVDDQGNPIFNTEAGLKLLPYGDFNQKDNLGIAVTPYAKGSTNIEEKLADNVTLKIAVTASAGDVFYITIQPKEIKGASGLSAKMEFLFEIKYASDSKAPVSLLSFGKSKLEVDALKLAFGGDLKGDFYMSGGVENLVLLFDFSETPILGNFISEPLTVDAGNLLLRWHHKKGISFDGGNNLKITLPTHIDLGPIGISSFGVGVNLTNKPSLIFDLSGKLELGPLKLSYESVGLKAGLEKMTNGMFGNYGPKFELKPPSGFGISIDAGVVTGGGFLSFDVDKEEYTGALELVIANFISARAIGIITTKMPDGSKGFSLLVIITAEFFPPFQLGFGFTLNAVGGLIGLNRTVLLDPLRDGVRTGAVNNIMFPTNVVANASRIISDLKTIFPVYEGKFLIGPMAKIGWGTPTLISLSFGLIVEIPGNIAILGVLKVVLPDEKVPVVKIQVAFVGTIDFSKKLLTFDASLFDSSILQTMTLEGDMAVRLSWGDQPDFIMSVGGFHPSYTPPPLALPTMKRLSISILNTSIAKIKVECYQAVTSNTVQFGAKADIYFDLKVCKIEGFIGFDALFQFNPFYFIISVSAGFKLKAAGISLMTVRIKMSLEGPTPWRAKGTGKVSLLFFDISANFDKTWGDKKDTSLEDVSVLTLFLDELKKKEQWSTALSAGKNLLVSLRKLEEAPENTLVLHPAGSITIHQKLMPLGVNIDKFGNSKPKDVKQLRIVSVKSGTMDFATKEVKENFARAQFQEMSDADKLSKPSFEKMPAGVEVSMGGSNVKNGKMVRRKIEYELTIIDKEPLKFVSFTKLFKEIAILFSVFIKGGSVAESKLSLEHQLQRQPFDIKVGVDEERFAVAFQNNNKAFNVSSTFENEMEAQSFMQDQIRSNPGLINQIHIIPQFELQES